MPNRVARFRRQRRLTQVELAEQAEVSRETISNIERGLSTPSLQVAFDIAAVLGQDVDTLFGDTPFTTRSLRPMDQILAMLDQAHAEVEKGKALRNMVQDDAETEEAMYLAVGVEEALKWILGRTPDLFQGAAWKGWFPIRDVDTSPEAIAETARMHGGAR